MSKYQKLSRIVTCALTAISFWALSAGASTVTYYHTDSVGSVVLETNGSGDPTSVVDYRPYGTAEMDSIDRAPGYTGHINDSSSGLTYMGARYYDPSVGQFISADPYGAAAGNISSIGRYNYANGNPYKYNDPEGRIPFFAFLALFAAGGTTALHSDFANAPAYESQHQSLALSDHMGALPGLNMGKALKGVSMMKAEVKAARSAEEAADMAKTAGKVEGAASELSVGGKVITVGVSGEKVAHTDEVLGALMGARGPLRPWHGGCAEVVCLNKAIAAGVDPRGGVMRTVNISNNPARHNTPKPACSSCVDVMKYFGVKH